MNPAHVTPRLTPTPRQRRHNAGFSLIEMIGALTLIGIFAAVITPNLAQSLSRSNGAKEDALLDTIGASLVDSVLLNQVIPGPKSWVAAVAKVANLSESEVLYAIPGNTASARVYLIDPSFSPADYSSSALSSSSSSHLWTQTSSGASTVSSARILILSVHKPGLTLPVSSGYASSSTVFDNIWNWSLDPATDAPPTGWSSAWTGNGEYLHVERINLVPYFHRITFNNTEYPTEYPYYRIGAASAVLLNSSSGFDAMYLRGTMVRVYADNASSSSPGTLQITHSVTAPDNFIYADGTWEMH